MTRAAPAAGAGADASERLARTRLAILEYLQRRRHGISADADTGDEGLSQDSQQVGSRWRGLREAGQRYWRDHPARLVVRLAVPLLAHWGRHHPLALVGIAAAAGALLVITRPWRLVSLTGLLVGTLKSPRLLSVAMSLLASARLGLRRRSRP